MLLFKKLIGSFGPSSGSTDGEDVKYLVIDQTLIVRLLTLRRGRLGRWIARQGPMLSMDKVRYCKKSVLTCSDLGAEAGDQGHTLPRSFTLLVTNIIRAMSRDKAVRDAPTT